MTLCLASMRAASMIHISALLLAPLLLGGAARKTLPARRPTKAPAATLTRVQTFDNGSVTRVALHVTRQVRTKLATLPPDPRAQAPARVVLDLLGARLPNTLARHYPVTDPLLRGVRLGRLGTDGVRVVLDLRQAQAFRLITLQKPLRLVLEAQDQATAAARRLAQRPKVVLDPGHGGLDGGAVGVRGCVEKEVVLRIARLAQQYLEAAGVDVLLTRDDDTYLPLEERAAIANRVGADAFVSIHANAARRSGARGIETYYLNVTDDRYALRLAAVENKTSVKQVSDLQLILADLSTKANSRTSMALAREVQNTLVHHARQIDRTTPDLGVKAALFYVLLGARMPAILVETAFISNPRDARLLQDLPYQRGMARALAQAVAAHVRAPLQVGRP